MSAPPPPAPLEGVWVDDLDLDVLAGRERHADGSMAAPVLWSALEELDRDRDRLTDRDQLEAVEAWRRLESASVARRLTHTAAFSLTPPGRAGVGGSVREFADDEIALRTRSTRFVASRDLATALRLRDHLPRTVAALRSGRIDHARAAAIASGAAGLPAHACAGLERRVLGRAVEQHSAATKQSVARAVLALDPEGAALRRARAYDERRVCMQRSDDGMADVWARLTGYDWVVMSTVLNAAARAVKASGDERTLDQLRADVLIAPFANALRTGVLDGLTPTTLARHRGVAPTVNVHVSATTLLGLDDEPGELEGWGPIPAALARELASCGTWRRILTDPLTGHVRDVGTATYSPPASMARWVELRDRTCRFPGCSISASSCDLDHAVPFPIGPTSTDNLHALCRRHHRLKHGLTGAGLRIDSQGTLTWTLPTGHYYRDRIDESDDPPD